MNKDDTKEFFYQNYLKEMNTLHNSHENEHDGERRANIRFQAQMQLNIFTYICEVIDLPESYNFMVGELAKIGNWEHDRNRL